MKTQNTKHKTLIVLILSLFLSNYLIAQTQSVIKLRPILGQGYLVFDKTNYPDVDRWQVSLFKREFFDSPDINYIQKEIASTKLNQGENFLFIPKKYREQSFSTNYLVNIIGLNSEGDVVVTENNVQLNDNNGDLFLENGEEPYLSNCGWTCLGDFYGYVIQQYKKPNNNLSRFQVEKTYKYFDPLSTTANPYYYYTNSDNGPAADGINKVQFYIGFNDPLHIYDAGGNALTGWIYGYAKGLGVWKGQSIISTGNQFTIGNEFCSPSFWSLNTAITLMNTNADFSQPAGLPNYPPLECVSANFGSGGGYIPVDTMTIPDEWEHVKFCFLNGDPVPCVDDDGNNPLAPLINPELVSKIIITDLNDNTKPPVTINVAELYNTNNGNGEITNGEFNGLNITLNPGLYSFGFMFLKNGYWAAIKELTTTQTVGVTQAEMIDIETYANPIVGEKYTIKMEARATLKFDYELRDFSGDLILTRNFMIHKGHEKTQKINKKNIPQGILFHRFVFEDGSVKTIQSIKK